jgi:membrane protein implicated in regulation of membrane protease activity
MKKMIYLMLTLMILGAASVNAQVRIGGTADPDKSAVLDLNSNDGTANGGLALPRVALTSETQQLNGAEPKPGTMVYNTNAEALDGEGAYVWTKVSGSENESQGVTSITGSKGIVVTNGTSATPDISLPAGTNGQVLKYDGTDWVAGEDSDTTDGGILSVIGTKGISASVVGDIATVGLPTGTNGQVLKYNGSAWAAGADNDTKDGGILTVSASRGITGTVNGTNLSLALPVTSREHAILSWNTDHWEASDFSLFYKTFVLENITVEHGVSRCFPAPGATSSMVCAAGWQNVYLKPTTDLICVLNMRHVDEINADFPVRCLSF